VTPEEADVATAFVVEACVASYHHGVAFVVVACARSCPHLAVCAPVATETSAAVATVVVDTVEASWAAAAAAAAAVESDHGFHLMNYAAAADGSLDILLDAAADEAGGWDANPMALWNANALGMASSVQGCHEVRSQSMNSRVCAGHCAKLQSQEKVS
jgi:hypothetical protein